eukprot:TRINITY_DN63722_c0_g1_i1.p1 TRINITY_DN63722_c0_g1~~TRINITY_DN63722_c0_g1_i1.p1  ORF type:complete len:451 (-),score=62.75 TRINITY_DN63722_c0_g1_i1:210-1508(-)
MLKVILSVPFVVLAGTPGSDEIHRLTETALAADSCDIDGDDDCGLSLRQLRGEQRHGDTLEVEERVASSGSCQSYGCSPRFAPGQSCQCNAKCLGFGNCCPDFKAHCAPRAAPPPAHRIGCDPKSGGLCPGGIACPADGWCPSNPAPQRHLKSSGTTNPRRLKITNGCSEPIWIAHIAAGGIGPDEQDKKLEPGQSFMFATSIGDKGMTATRYWPKVGCDAHGNNCAIGDSGGPEEGCVSRGPGRPDDYSKCAPPIDSKFEATYASAPDRRDKDIVDMSLVDGYTLPFKLEMNGTCTRHGIPFTKMDCSELSLKSCPTDQMVESVGSIDLRAVNPKTGKVGGCYSTCMKITDDKWGHPHGGPDSPKAAPYCCAGTHGTPGVCNAGPVVQTQYLKEVHAVCPAAYGYAYDDVRATIACDADTEYSLTFYCPKL